ncbi:MAG: hypothetical protein Q9157_004319 [Trypethelium eluteriae]
MYSSNSPNAKRNLKPTGQQPQAYSAGTSASPTQLTLSSTQPTGPYSALGHPSDPFASYQPPPTGPGPLNPPPPPPPNQQQPNPRKRRADDPLQPGDVAAASSTAPFGEHDPLGPPGADLGQPQTAPPPPKKGRTNTPWTPAEEQRLKTMRDQGTSWSEIAKVGFRGIRVASLAIAHHYLQSRSSLSSLLKHFPSRTEGSVKKHWYKVNFDPNLNPDFLHILIYVTQDMHYAEFAEDEVGSFVGLYYVDGDEDLAWLTEKAEPGVTGSDQGVRSK